MTAHTDGYTLHRLVRGFALTIAILIAVTVPLLYAVDRYVGEMRFLEFRTQLAAEKVARFIYGHGQLWQYQPLRIVDLIAVPSNMEIHQQVINGRGRDIVDLGPRIAFPRLRQDSPIVVAEQTVGKVTATISMEPALVDLGWVIAASFTLAFLIYFAVRMLPLRALDKTLKQLALQNIRFEAALDNMSQGLCMLDAGNRITVLNRRFAAMFGIADRGALSNALPCDLVQAAAEAGTLATPLGEELFLFPKARDGDATSFIHELPDGRTLVVSHQPVKGGGQVTTFEDITDRRDTEARLDHMALHDALTNLPNRVLFRVHLERQLSLIGRGDDEFAVLFLDLDRFKSVNDTLGHQVGDELLQAVAARLKECIRESDVIARLGGDEFAIIQSDAEQPTSATALARRLVEVIGAPYEVGDHQIVVGLSLGIALVPGDGLTSDDVLKNADLALYRAKAAGRGTYRFFEPVMNAQMQERRILEMALRHALPNQELVLFFQPLVNMASQKVCGFEALLRWQHPTRGLVLPGDFIPLAEEVGLIVSIGEWVLEQGCLEASRWPPEICLSINVSVAQFRSPHLVEATERALRISGLDPGRLDIEITESVLMHDTQATLATLRRLGELGVRISMDDFGTGYSSLSYLRSFPFHKIKIDQCFVRDLGTDKGSVAIIRAVVNLGRALGMSVTAEGVETQEQLAQIRAEGCAEGQGYLFSRACPADEVAGTIVRLNQITAMPQIAGAPPSRAPADLAA